MNKLKQVRGSLQVENSKSGNGVSPLIKGSQKRIVSQQSATDIDKNREPKTISGKVSVGKMLQNSYGGNTLFLDLGKQNWSSNQILNNEPGLNAAGPRRDTHVHKKQVDDKNVDILSQLKDLEYSANAINESLERERDSLCELNMNRFPLDQLQMSKQNTLRIEQ